MNFYTFLNKNAASSEAAFFIQIITIKHLLLYAYHGILLQG